MLSPILFSVRLHGSTANPITEVIQGESEGLNANGFNPSTQLQDLKTFDVLKIKTIKGNNCIQIVL